MLACNDKPQGYSCQRKTSIYFDQLLSGSYQILSHFNNLLEGVSLINVVVQ